MMLLRHLLSIAILPFTVTVLVPWWIRPRGVPSVFEIPLSRGQGALMGLGLILTVVGLILFGSSLQRFATDGKGTLAPWDPPRDFVVTGPYRYVRNPMISGVILILFGEAAIFQTRGQLAWAFTFIAMNALMIPLFEEPQLRSRFGEPYVEYSRHVGRLIPRLTPWKPEAR
jgi:protein-S-isoprenylcysteine O-methyltransferase Ste14